MLDIPNPRMVWWSGYKIPVQAWKEWTPTLPIRYHFNIAGSDLMLHSLFYQMWRFHLPKEEAKLTPTYRHMYPGNNQPVEFVFFPLRYTSYTGEDQVNADHPDHSTICQENETDKARLTNFLNYVKDKGTPLDGTKLSFAWMKNEHPRDDPRAW